MREKQIADAVVAEALLEKKIEKVFLGISAMILLTFLSVLGALSLTAVASFGSHALPLHVQHLLRLPLTFAPLAFIPAGLFMVIGVVCVIKRAAAQAKLEALGIPGYGEPAPLLPPVPTFGSGRGSSH